MTLAPGTARVALTPYQRRLFVFLGVATFFEGFDYIAFSRILPTLREEFAFSEYGAGVLTAVVGCGAILAYGIIRWADVVGRRRVLALTIAGYTAASLLTAAVQDVFQFGVAQMFARMFLLAEYAVSMVYVAEEFPAERRGFAVGVLQGLSSLGSVVCAGIAPWLIASPWGFRSLYVVGAVPLLLMMFLRRSVRETARFSELTERPRFTDVFRVFRTPYWRRIPLLATIWALTYLCTYTMVTFWTDFAVSERGFSQKMVSLSLMYAALASLPFVFLSGRFLDAVGRRRGATVIFVVAALAALLAYLGQGFWPLTCGLALGIFSASGVLPVLSSLTLELFPTELRADAYGWVNNVFARIVGYVAGPFVIGLAAERVGYGASVSATAIFPLLALALILAKLPETSGKELEETSALH